MKKAFYLFTLLLAWGCQSKNLIIEPTIVYFPQERQFQEMPSPYPPLSSIEMSQDWGKELAIALHFAKELDLYRAITAYKRALILIPPNENLRREQIEYGIILSYYLGRKYSEAINFFESSTIKNANQRFPAFRELAIILEDAYRENCRFERADYLLNIINTMDTNIGENLKLGNTIRDADFCEIPINEFITCYKNEALSVKKAEFLNTILPGVGYFYVGQPKAGITAILVNSLTIAAAYYCFDHGNIAAGLLLTSLETGWYFGGIQGAGLAAKQYNENLYQHQGKNYMIENCLFPIMMLRFSF